MRIVFLGTGSFGVPALNALAARGHAICAVLSQPDRPGKRGLHVQPTPIRERADDLGLPHIQTADVNSPEHVAVAGRADIGVVVDFGQKLDGGLLAAAPRGFVNIHASLLPRYRGAAPYQWAIIRGEATTGVTTFQLSERMDAGGIWMQRETAIGALETADELHDRLALIGAELIVETLELIAGGGRQPGAQDASRATRAPKLSRSDSLIDWALPAADIVRRVHGLWSWPTAAATFASRLGRRERVQFARARAIDASSADACAPGSVIDASGAIQAGQGRVLPLEVKPAGGKLMPYDAFTNGRRVDSGDCWLPLDAP